ncbi:hypothetical protein [Methanocaldococcus villosus]|uniref:hypothetical protein n=1 Tax=Methanocaldococcus villosus TaxID=667126 RepID=UPI000377CFE7|nr:hypothetical protein [Methanocaldococcus villosus]
MELSEKDNILKKIAGNVIEIDEFYVNAGDKGIKKRKQTKKKFKKERQGNIQN